MPLTGEPLALDLLNTRANTPLGEIDVLDSAEHLTAWLATQAHRLPPLPTAVAGDDLAAIRNLRDHIRAMIDAARHGTTPPAAATENLNATIRAAPQYPTVRWDGTTPVAVPHRDGPAPTQLLATLAEATIDLLTRPDVSAIRACEGPQCRMLFLPVNPRRRWCSPAACGNRVRVARYYRRHRP